MRYGCVSVLARMKCQKVWHVMNIMYTTTNTPIAKVILGYPESLAGAYWVYCTVAWEGSRQWKKKNSAAPMLVSNTAFRFGEAGGAPVQAVRYGTRHFPEATLPSQSIPASITCVLMQGCQPPFLQITSILSSSLTVTLLILLFLDAQFLAMTSSGTPLCATERRVCHASAADAPLAGVRHCASGCCQLFLKDRNSWML